MVPSFYAQMLNKDSIAEHIQKIVNDPSLFLVDIKITSGPSTNKLKVILDGDQGITIEQCAHISRGISDWLDSDASVQDSFILEVTSPGIDQPLQLRRQYVKNIGRKVKIRLTDNTETKGLLKEVGDNFIVLENLKSKDKRKKSDPDQWVKIPLEQIRTATVQISFKH